MKLLHHLLIGCLCAVPIANAGEGQPEMVPVARYVNRPETEKDSNRAHSILRDHQINGRTDACFGATMSVPAIQAPLARQLLARGIKEEGLQLTLVELTPKSEEAAAVSTEPLIPAALNAILSKIHAGMSVDEVTSLLGASYPQVKRQIGKWSGTSGYLEYKLDERYSFGIAAITRDGKDVVHEEMSLHLYDWPAKRRLDLKAYAWEKETDKQNSAK